MHWLTRFSLLALSVPSFAAPIIIDDFDTPQFFGVGPSGSNPLSASSGVVTGPDSFGGARSVTLTRTAGSGFEFVNVSSGLFEFNLGAGDNGFVQINWDGNTDAVLDQAGVAPVDLSDGGSNDNFFVLLRSDSTSAGAPITFTIYSGVGNASSFTIFAPGGGFAIPFTAYYIPFSAFAVTSGTGGLFTQVTAISAMVDGTNPLHAGADFQMDIVGVSGIPEPGTFGLAGLVLAGLAFRLRRGRL